MLQLGVHLRLRHLCWSVCLSNKFCFLYNLERRSPRKRDKKPEPTSKDNTKRWTSEGIMKNLSLFRSINLLLLFQLLEGPWRVLFKNTGNDCRSLCLWKIEKPWAYVHCSWYWRTFKRSRTIEILIETGQIFVTLYMKNYLGFSSLLQLT